MLNICIEKLKVENFQGSALSKMTFIIICEVKIWYQPHKKWGTGRKGGWMDGRVDGKAGLRIAYTNQKRFSQFY